MTPPEDIPEQPGARPGLEQLQDMVSGLQPLPPMGKLLNFKMVFADHGKVVFEGAPDASVTTPAGTVHGGWYGAILDSCMACAVHSQLAKGQIYTTLEFKINLVRAFPLGTQVRATGTVRHMGRSTGVADGALRGIRDDRLYALGTTTCIIMTPG